jgi:hypothetical protein
MYQRFFLGVKRQGVKLNTQLDLVSRLRMSGAPYMLSNTDNGKSTFYLLHMSRHNIYCLRHNELLFVTPVDNITVATREGARGRSD